MKKESYSIVYEKKLESYLEDATIDFRKSFLGESGFTVLSNCC